MKSIYLVLDMQNDLVHADGPNTACGRHDTCTRVVTKHRGVTQHKHWVCSECRARMRIPEFDCQIDEHQTIRPWR